jgi:hypothetical protein
MIHKITNRFQITNPKSKSVSLTSSMILALMLGVTTLTVAAESQLTPQQKTRVVALLDSLSPVGSDPMVVNAVKTQNAKLPELLQGLTNEKWKELNSGTPEVKLLSHSDLSRYMRGKVHHSVIEMFINDAEGRKVAFFAKTTSFIHKGKAKHDKPMTGKQWIGEPEIDESTQQLQVQGSFPVLDAGKPIGSIVLGFWVPKL